MNFRQTAILIGAVFAVVVVLLVLTFTADDNAPATDVLTEELVGIAPEEIDTVEMDRDTGGHIKMVRTDAAKKKWEIVEPFHASADGTAIQAIVNALMRAKPTASPEITSNPANHGLQPPSLKVTLRSGDKSSTVNLGDVTIGGGRAPVFVTTSARPNRPMAVPRGELEPLFREQKGGVKAADIAKWTSDLRTRSIFPAESQARGNDVAFVKLDLPNKKKELALARTPSGDWKFVAPAGWGDADTEGESGGSPGIFTGVGPMLSALVNVSAISPADFIDQPKDLKEYGLNPDSPDLIRVEMKTRDGQTAIVTFGKIEAGVVPPPPIPGMPPQPMTGGKVYVRIEGQPGVIRAGAANLSGLSAVIEQPNPLRDRDLLRLERGKQVDGLDILLAGQTPDKPTKLRKVQGQWKLYGGPNDPQPALTAAVAKIVDVVSAKRSIRDFPPSNQANFAAISATLYVWVDGFNPPPPDPKAEPVKKSEPIKLEFGRKEGEMIYVRRTLPGNQVNEFTLPTSVRVGMGLDTADVLATIAKSRLDLLDTSLPTFSPNAPVRVTVTGQNNYTLEKAKNPDPYTHEALWQFVSPEPKGRTADTSTVSDILTQLGKTSSMSRYVTEQPTKKELDDYGLTPTPKLKVVVGLPGEERAYEFGKETADGLVYARFGDKPAVFTLPKLLFDKFATPDLRDRVLFRFDPTKATAVELHGWGHLGLGEQILRFERKNKDDMWVGTVGTDKKPFATDPKKVDQFLSAMVQARVKTFIVGKGQKPEYGFGNANSLIVTITISTGDTTKPTEEVYANFGAATDNGESYYTFARSLPPSDPFCTVDSRLLKPFKDGPVGFIAK